MTLSVWILGDQLLDHHPAVEAAQQHDDDILILLIESHTRAHKQAYNRKKLILLWSAMRHYAQRLREAGFTVDYVTAETFTQGLREHVAHHQPDGLLTMAAADYAGRTYQQTTLPEIVGCPVEVLDNQQFLVEHFNPIPEPEQDKRYVMEYFYRDMRRHFGVLVDEEGEPTGGQWNYDKQNREKLPPDLSLPDVPPFPADAITQEVIDTIEGWSHLVGTSKGFGYAVTHDDAAHALDDFIRERFAEFGPYEDAMTTRHTTLFHSVLSPYLNIGLLTPMQCIAAAVEAFEAGEAPINSVEGFVRQILGWREFMYWQYWRQMPDLTTKNGWDAQRAMPQMFWDGETDMACIRHVAQRAREQGYTHHIERLMIVTNYCTLAGITPQAVVEWFTAFYIDAYDWVMQPNVVGMGLNADGGLTATKPYISSSNYINKMSDYCTACSFDRSTRHGEDACPFNLLYWNFLIQHEDTLRANPRFGKAVFGLRYLDDDDRAAVTAQAEDYLDQLAYYGE